MNWTGALSGPEIQLSTVLVIVGPTAAGKSAVAVELALRFDGEIIGLDSRQVYKYMSIGTAQPAEKDRKGIRHHLYGIREPGEPVSAGEYARMVEKTAAEIVKRSRFPIVCGGSGLYARALTRGIFEESRSDPDVRRKLKHQLAEKGAGELLTRLEKIDPDYARIVHPNNHKRLLRALEIVELTGQPPTEHFKSQQPKSSPFDYLTVYLRPDLEMLSGRIEKRTRSMLEAGWIDEVKKLIQRDFDSTQAPLDSLGYREVVNHLNGEYGAEELVEKINLTSRQYARKQIKWFDSEPVDLRIDLGYETPVESVVERIVEWVKMRLMT